jgi:hypothetical protein
VKGVGREMPQIRDRFMCDRFRLNAFAQQPLPSVEVFTGYSFERHGDANLDGWRGSVAWNRNNWLALVADASGHYDGQNIIAFGVPARANLNAYTFLFGPKFSLRTNSRITPFSQFLAGLSRVTASGVLLDRSGPRQKETGHGFGLATGGGFDLRISNRLALRVAQADYTLWRRNSNGVRFSSGTVFRFDR